MTTDCLALIVERIRESGPMTFAEFMDVALYHPEVGYYARASRRSGRAGDFYTSVDVGPAFGELLARQFVEMFRLLSPNPESPTPGSATAAYPQSPNADLDLVEAGAGNGRLSRDVLEALELEAPDLYGRIRLFLVERSAAARNGQAATLGRHAKKLAESGPDLPAAVHGIVFANELLDALPTHAVVAREEGLREVVIDQVEGQLVEREAPLSTPAISDYLRRSGVTLEPGWRGEVNLQAVDWIERVGNSIERGFVTLIDYGHEASQLYSAAHADGTLSTFTQHVIEVRDAGRQPWLRAPGQSDITAHVDFTAIRHAAEASGMKALCVVDQMHFLLGLGAGRLLQPEAGNDRNAMMRRLALKTLLVPGGLGTSHSVMIFGKDMGTPSLAGCSGRLQTG